MKIENKLSKRLYEFGMELEKVYISKGNLFGKVNVINGTKDRVMKITYKSKVKKVVELYNGVLKFLEEIDFLIINSPSWDRRGEDLGYQLKASLKMTLLILLESKESEAEELLAVLCSKFSSMKRITFIDSYADNLKKGKDIKENCGELMNYEEIGGKYFIVLYYSRFPKTLIKMAELGCLNLENLIELRDDLESYMKKYSAGNSMSDDVYRLHERHLNLKLVKECIDIL